MLSPSNLIIAIILMASVFMAIAEILQKKITGMGLHHLKGKNIFAKMSSSISSFTSRITYSKIFVILIISSRLLLTCR